MACKTTFKPFLSLLILFFCAVTFGFGQSIFENPIEGTNPGASNPYTIGQIINENITVSGIRRGPGINMSAATNNRYNATSWNTLDLDPTAYFEFTIIPNSGYEIDFDSFIYTGQTSPAGPINFAFKSSLDDYIADIGSSNATGATIDLSGADYQNIATSVTFRIYGWGGSDGLGTFSINDFTFNGTVRAVAACASATTTWDGTDWDNGLPDLTTPAILNGSYNTFLNGDISACSLVVNSGFTLNVSDNTFVEIQNDVDVFGTGTIAVETHGAFVQNDDNSTFTVSETGNSYVRKSTSILNEWYFYTYWSSPVSGLTIETSPLVDSDRRYWYDAANFEDVLTEIGNTNTFGPGSDDIDDDGNDWQFAGNSYPMTPGIGFAATHSQLGYLGPRRYDYDFYGEFNNGIITTPILYNGDNGDKDWNLIGNPFPSALDFNAFYAANSGVIDGAAYLWSHRTLESGNASGNQAFNFSQNDYAIITAGSGSINNSDNGDGNLPNDYIPSGQGFFISGLANGNITFNNSMRMADATSNSQFFKLNNSKSKVLANKFWINLTSDNGVFNQILVAYVDGASNNYDGMAYDAPRNLSSGVASMIYTLIEDQNSNSTKKYAIQGKNTNSLNFEETVPIGFFTTIESSTIYKLSLPFLQGDFLTANAVYLKDNLTGTVHNLKECDYTFTSEVGEFNDRFVVMFNNQSLSTDELLADANTLKIIDLDDNHIQFTVPTDLKINTVSIFNLLGKEIYKFNGQNSSETYAVSGLNQTIYIAKVTLSNGTIMTKKAFKK